MFHMGNGEMRWKSRHGIAEDPVFVSIENPPLFGGQIVEAQETRTVLDILLSTAAVALVILPGLW
jgi:hypothetical protein